MSELYSPELSDLITKVTQWNIKTFNEFREYLKNPNVELIPVLYNLVDIGETQNKYILEYLTNVEKGVIIN